MARTATALKVIRTLKLYEQDLRVLVDVDGARYPLKWHRRKYVETIDGDTDKDVVLVAGKAIEREASG